VTNLDQTQQNFLFLFLGSLLTFFGSFIVELLKDRRIEFGKEKNFKFLVSQEFNIVARILENLRLNLVSKNYFDFQILDNLISSIRNLEEYRKDSIYLKDTNLLQKFIDLTSDLGAFQFDVRGIQQVYYNQKSLIDIDVEARKPSNIDESVNTYKQKSIFDSYSALDQYFSTQKTEQSINLIELRRRTEDLSERLVTSTEK